MPATKRLAVASFKGGVGKSTTTMMLADSLAYHHGAHVLLVDLDAQANCGQMLLSYGGLKIADTGRRTITNWVDCHARGVNADFFECISTGVCGLQEVKMGTRVRAGAPRPGQISIVPSTPKLRFAELAFDHKAYDAKDRAAPRKAMAKLLDKALHSVRETYDYILFDCPPGFTTLSQAALSMADGILTPLLEDPVSVWSLKALRDFGLRDELNVWRREAHRVLYTRVRRQGADAEKLAIRTDVTLAGFEALNVSIPDATHAIRWAQRTDPENFRTYRDKYAHLGSTVEQLGREVVAFLQNLRTREIEP